jgi:hypothetical protein
MGIPAQPVTDKTATKTRELRANFRFRTWVMEPSFIYYDNKTCPVEVLFLGLVNFQPANAQFDFRW